MISLNKIDHLVITTADVSACLGFYKRLGFEVRDGGGRYALYAGDFKINVHILGQELTPHAQAVTPGSCDLCFEVSGTLADYKKMVEASGLDIHLGIVPRTGVKGAMQSLYLYDPDGNLVEFCSYETTHTS